MLSCSVSKSRLKSPQMDKFVVLVVYGLMFVLKKAQKLSKFELGGRYTVPINIFLFMSEMFTNTDSMNSLFVVSSGTSELCSCLLT